MLLFRAVADHAEAALGQDGRCPVHCAGAAMRDVAAESARAAAATLTAHRKAVGEAVTAAASRVGSVSESGRAACSASEMLCLGSRFQSLQTCSDTGWFCSKLTLRHVIVQID